METYSLEPVSTSYIRQLNPNGTTENIGICTRFLSLDQPSILKEVYRHLDDPKIIAERIFIQNSEGDWIPLSAGDMV